MSKRKYAPRYSGTKSENEQAIYWSVYRKVNLGERVTQETIEDALRSTIDDRTIPNILKRLKNAGVLKRKKVGRIYEYTYDSFAARQYFSGRKMSRATFFRRVAKWTAEGWLEPIGLAEYRFNANKLMSYPEFVEKINGLFAMVDEFFRPHNIELKLNLEDFLKYFSRPMTVQELRDWLDESQNYIGIEKQFS